MTTDLLVQHHPDQQRQRILRQRLVGLGRPEGAPHAAVSAARARSIAALNSSGVSDSRDLTSRLH